MKRSVWLLLVVAGCAKQDVDGLGRIGSKIRNRTSEAYTVQANGPLLRELRGSTATLPPASLPTP